MQTTYTCKHAAAAGPGWVQPPPHPQRSPELGKQERPALHLRPSAVPPGRPTIPRAVAPPQLKHAHSSNQASTLGPSRRRPAHNPTCGCPPSARRPPPPPQYPPPHGAALVILINRSKLNTRPIGMAVPSTRRQGAVGWGCEPSSHRPARSPGAPSPARPSNATRTQYLTGEPKSLKISKVGVVK
jgi:hypothetical protein